MTQRQMCSHRGKHYGSFALGYGDSIRLLPTRLSKKESTK
jgi:hypothetical protein